MLRSILAAGLVVFLPLLQAPLARADHDDDDQGKGHHGKHWKHDDDGDHHKRFSSHDHDVARVYFQEEYGRGHCPPGLAKKHNGCMPPGLAKRRYVIGQPLAPHVVLVPVPVALAYQLGPPPVGYRYGMIDGDLVELAVGTALVVDAIQGLAN
jgi:Ni/Co efflux regulator RcnB